MQNAWNEDKNNIPYFLLILMSFAFVFSATHRGWISSYRLLLHERMAETILFQILWAVYADSHVGHTICYHDGGISWNLSGNVERYVPSSWYEKWKVRFLYRYFHGEKATFWGNIVSLLCRIKNLKKVMLSLCLKQKAKLPLKFDSSKFN